jgi:hypothetical protein
MAKIVVDTYQSTHQAAQPVPAANNSTQNLPLVNSTQSKSIENFSQPSTEAKSTPAIAEVKAVPVIEQP